MLPERIRRYTALTRCTKLLVVIGSDEAIGHGPQARRFGEASDQAEASTVDCKVVIAFDTEPADYKERVCVIDSHTMSDRKPT